MPHQRSNFTNLSNMSVALSPYIFPSIPTNTIPPHFSHTSSIQDILNKISPNQQKPTSQNPKSSTKPSKSIKKFSNGSQNCIPIKLRTPLQNQKTLPLQQLHALRSSIKLHLPNPFAPPHPISLRLPLHLPPSSHNPGRLSRSTRSQYRGPPLVRCSYGRHSSYRHFSGFDLGFNLH